jgi:exopolysaccharide biosynthesis polyprenyl glycosylphosphotransferase
MISKLRSLEIIEHSPSSTESAIIIADSSLIIFLEKMGPRYDLQLFVKRFMDIVGAVFGIVILSPLMLIIAVIIKLTSKGPVLFRQERFGYQGKKFTFLKFRSMYVCNDDNVHREYMCKLIMGDNEKINMGSRTKPYFKIKNDLRITPFGRILRKSSLDELPQFFNVLIGDMSLVGPRPPIQYEVDKYKTWHRKRVLDAKPGITGLWQVKGRSQTTFEEMVRLDLQYIRDWDLWLDFKILFDTFKTVFAAKGAD